MQNYTDSEFMKYLGNELQKQLPGLGFALFVFPLLGP